ncbi:MAG: 30S ribosomal protein S21 [Anaerolineae bacterium]
MTYVKRRSGESVEQLIKRFRKRVTKDRIKSELKKRRYFITKGEEERIQRRKAERKMRKRQHRNRYNPY